MASGVSEAGVGTSYEFLVATYLWGLLAAEETFPVGGGTVNFVALQRSHIGTGYDDLEVRTAERTKTKTWLIQVKRSISFRASDAVFQEIIQRLYKDIQKPEFTDASFLIVAQRVPKSYDDARDLTELARSSLGSDDLVAKLLSENQGVRGIYQSIESILKTISPITPENLHKLLRALHLWHLPLENPHSTEWSNWRSLLLPRIDSGARAKVDELKSTFYQSVSAAGRYRTEHTFETLRQAFPLFDRPVRGDPSATDLAERTLAKFRAQVESWRTERHTTAFETLTAVQSFCAEAESWFLVNGRKSPTAQEYASIVAAAVAIEGSLLITLDYDRELRAWLQRAIPYSELDDWVRETLARIYLILKDYRSFEEWKNRIQSSEIKTLLTVFFLQDSKEWDKAVSLAKSLTGPRRAVALTVGRMCRSEQAHNAIDPQESLKYAIEGLELAKEACLLSPERPMLGLAVAEAAYLTVIPSISKAYQGAKNVTPADIGTKLEEAITVFNEVLGLRSWGGVHEQTISALCATELMRATGIRPYLPAHALEDTNAYAVRLNAPKLLNIAQLMIQYGKTEQAMELVSSLEREDANQEDRDLASKFRQAIGADRSTPPLAIDNDISVWNWGEVSLINAVGVVTEGASVPTELLKIVDDKTVNTAWLPAVHFLYEFSLKNYVAAEQHLDKIIDTYPEAVVVFGELSIAMSSAYGRVKSLRLDQDDEADPSWERPQFEPEAEKARDLILKVLHHCGEALGLRGSLGSWLYVASTPLDRLEFERLANACEKHGHRSGYWSARFLDEYTRQRGRQTAEVFEEGLSEGWKPQPGLQEAYDRTRAKLGRWKDLAKEARNWLLIEERSALALQAPIQGLIQTGRPEEAFQLAEENASDFPDDADALFLVFTTARACNKEDWVRYFIDFTTRFPDDSRAGRPMTVDEAAKRIFEPTPRALLLEKQIEGSFPLHFLETFISVAFEKALMSTGLRLWRPGIPFQGEQTFDKPILMDLVSILVVDHIDLWEPLKKSGLKLLVHPSVIDYLRAESASLKLEAEADGFKVASRGYSLLETITKSGEAIGNTDVDEAKRIGGVVCDSHREEMRTLLNLIDNCTKIGHAERQRLKRTLEPHLRTNRKPDESNSAESNVVLSASDVQALCIADEVDAVLRCFDRVSVSREGRFWIDRFFLHAYVSGKAAVRSKRTHETVQELLESGQLTYSSSFEEPSPSETRFIIEFANVVRQGNLSAWVDDAAFRRVLAHEVPGIATCCIWDILIELRRREALSVQDYDSISAESIRSKFFPVVRYDAIQLIREAADGDTETKKYIARICLDLSPGPDEALDSRMFELHLAADQFLWLIKSEKEWESVSELFLQNLPSPDAHFFWERVVFTLANNPKDLWPVVRRMAVTAENRGQFEISKSLVHLSRKEGWSLPTQSYKNPFHMSLTKFEFRWRAVRQKLRNRTS